MGVWNYRAPCGSQVDWGHPLTNGLRAFWPFGETCGAARDLVQGYTLAPISTTAETRWRDGYHIPTAGAGTVYLQGTGPKLDGKPMTVLFAVRNPEVGTQGSHLSVGTASSTRAMVHFRYPTATTLLFALFSDDLTGTVATVSTRTNAVPVCGTVSQDLTQTLYENGRFVASRTAGGFYGGNRTVSVGLRTGEAQKAGNIRYVVMWDRCLCPAEVATVSANPFQMLRSPVSSSRVIANFAASGAAGGGSGTAGSGGSLAPVGARCRIRRRHWDPDE